MNINHLYKTTGPFRAEHLRSGDPYELSNGYAIECMPTGGQGSRANLLGGSILDTDPNVVEAGVDTGFSPNSGTLRAPDVAVGNIPNASGWVEGVPLLAVEYADSGQDERMLQDKIQELLSAGTKIIWVVRLTGPRRVEVYQLKKKVKLYYPDQTLTAPGILKNPVPVESLYDRNAAHEVTLRNLLQRKGYSSIEEIRAESENKGRAEGEIKGIAKGEAKTLKRLLALRFGDLPDWAIQQIDLASFEQLDVWIDGFLTAKSIEDLFD